MRFDEHLLTTSTQLVPVALLRIAALLHAIYTGPLLNVLDSQSIQLLG